MDIEPDVAAELRAALESMTPTRRDACLASAATQAADLRLIRSRTFPIVDCLLPSHDRCTPAEAQ